MADENHIIRIILEGRDKLSGAFAGTRKNIKNDINQIRKDIKAWSTDLEKVENSKLFGGADVFRGPKGFTSLESAGREVDKLNEKLRNLKAQAKDESFFGGFGQGLREANITGQNIQQLLSQRQEDIRARRVALDEETRARQVQHGLDKKAQKEALRLEQENAKQLNRDKAAAEEKLFQEREKQRILDLEAEKTKLRDAEKDAKIDRNLQFRQRANVLQASKKGQDVDTKNDIEFTISEEKKARDRDNRAREKAVRGEITKLEAAKQIERDKDRKAVDDIITVRNDAQRKNIREENAELRQSQAAAANKIISEQSDKRAQLVSPNSRDIRNEQQELRKFSDEAHRTDNRIQRLGRTSGIWLGDLKRGLREGRSGMFDLSHAATEGESRMARLGQRVGALVGQFGTLVNLRWFFLTSIIQVLGTLVVQLGAAFISLAGSASFAAAAIGAAFAAAASQAIPTIGLLAAALSRFQKVLAAVKLNTQARKDAQNPRTTANTAQQERESTERVADAQYSLKQAYQAVGDAQYAFKQSTLAVTDAQYSYKQAIKGVADAQYSLKQATIAVGDAQYSLKQSIQGVKDAYYEHAQAVKTVSEAQYSLHQSNIAITNSLEAQKDAVRSLAQTRIDVSRGVVDSYFAERQAAISLRDAELGVVDAKRQLLQTEKDQKNNQADIEAAKGAVREAQQRLAAARAEADQAGIANARAQLAVAEQGLSAIQTTASTTNTAVAEAKNNVKQAILDRDKAKVDNKRTQEDSKKTQTEGLKNNQQFVSAQRQVRDAVRAVADARHSEKQAEEGVKAARHDELATERAIIDARRQEKAAERGVQDARRQEREARLGVADARHQEAQAARGIGDARHQEEVAERGIRDAKHQLVIATRELRDAEADRKKGADQQTASANSLKVALAGLSPAERRLYDSILRIQKAWAKAVRPITDIIINAFTRAVDRAAGLLKSKKLLDAGKELANSIAAGIDRISSFTSSPKFIATFAHFTREAAKNLPTFVDAIINLLDAFTQLAKLGEPFFKNFLNSLDSITGKFDKLLHNKDKTDKFFKIAGESLHNWVELAKAIGRIFLALLGGSQHAGNKILVDFTNFLNGIADWMNKHPKQVQKFFDDMARNLEKIAKAASKLAPILLDAFSSKEAANFTVFILEVIIPGLILLIQTLQQVTTFILFLTHIPFLGQFIKWAIEIAVAEKALNKIFPVTQKLTDIFKYLAERGAFKKIIPGLRLLRAALIATFVDTPWGFAILAVIAAVVLLDRKFHFIRPTIEAIKHTAEFVFNWFKDNWRKLPAIIGQPFVTAGIYVRKFFTETIPDAFNRFIKWVTTNAPRIAAAIGRPFVVAFEAVKKFFGRQIPQAVENSIAWLKRTWNTVTNIITHPFIVAYEAVERFFTVTVPRVITNFINWFRNHWKVIAAIAIGIFTFPLGPIAFAIVHWRDKIIGVFTSVIDWFRSHWKTIATIVAAIFAFPAGLIAVAIVKWHDDILKVVKKVADGFVGFFTKLPDRILGVLKSLPQKILDLFDGFGPKLLKKVVTSAPGLGTIIKVGAGVVDKAKDVGGFLKKHLATGGPVSKFRREVRGDAPSGSDTVPAFLTPGEWVLNADHQEKLAKVVGSTQDTLSRFLFDTPGLPASFIVGNKNTTPGLITEGNIDINHRPIAHNADGSISTVRSISIADDKGHAYLIPTVIGGRVVSNEEAIAHFNTTNRNLGYFSTEKQANEYGNKLHEQQDKLYSNKRDSVKTQLHPGDWVVNAVQQNRIAKAMGQAPDAIAKFLFGTGIKGIPGIKTENLKKGNYEAFSGPNYKLIPHTDDGGTTVWFIEFADKTFGQVNTKDANKIIASGGKYLPNYVFRHGGLMQGALRPLKRNLPDKVRIKPSYGLGGAGGSTQYFSHGGPVTNKPSNKTNNVTQNFTVKTEGETDWHYVMRLGAIHAQESF